MQNKKSSLRKLLRDKSAFTRFEILEQYAMIADDADDIIPIQRALAEDPDPIVRHEAAAQLLKIETSKPELSEGLKRQIQNALLKSVLKDQSVIVRHEAMEALAYIGDESALPILENLIDDANTDIKCTARIARDILIFRLKNGVSGAEFSGALISRNGS